LAKSRGRKSEGANAPQTELDVPMGAVSANIGSQQCLPEQGDLASLDETTGPS